MASRHKMASRQHKMATCFACGKKGHIAPVCSSKRARAKRNKTHTNIIESGNFDNFSYEDVLNYRKKAEVLNYHLRIQEAKSAAPSALEVVARMSSATERCFFLAVEFTAYKLCRLRLLNLIARILHS